MIVHALWADTKQSTHIQHNNITPCMSTTTVYTVSGLARGAHVFKNYFQLTAKCGWTSGTSALPIDLSPPLLSWLLAPRTGVEVSLISLVGVISTSIESESVSGLRSSSELTSALCVCVRGVCVCVCVCGVCGCESVRCVCVFGGFESAYKKLKKLSSY